MGERLRASGRTESTVQLGPLSLAADPSSHWPSTPKLSLHPRAQQGHPAPPNPPPGQRSLGRRRTRWGARPGRRLCGEGLGARGPSTRHSEPRGPPFLPEAGPAALGGSDKAR